MPAAFLVVSRFLWLAPFNFVEGFAVLCAAHVSGLMFKVVVVVARRDRTRFNDCSDAMLCVEIQGFKYSIVETLRATSRSNFDVY